MLSADTRTRIVEAALALLDTPVSHAGRRPGVGLDCGGVAVCAAARVPEIEAPDFEGSYGKNAWIGIGLYDALRDRADEIALEDARPGDVLLFWMRRPFLPQHVAVLVEPQRMVHAWTEFKRVKLSNVSGIFAERKFAAFRFRLRGSSPAHEVEGRVRCGRRIIFKGECLGNDCWRCNR